MNHEPGTRINYYGDEDKGRSLTPMIMARITQIRDQQKMEVDTGAFTRTFGNVTVKCVFHNDQTHIFIHVPGKIGKKEKKIKKLSEENNYIRFYVHIDIISDQTFSNVDDAILRSNIKSFISSAIWDEGASQFVDIKTVESDKLFFYNYTTSPPAGYESVIPNITNGYGDELVNYYESIIPSRYGVGFINPSLSSLGISAYGGPCPFGDGYYYSGSYYSTVIPEGKDFTPWRIADPWRASSGDTVVTTTHPDGCCNDTYSEINYTFDGGGAVVDINWEYGSTPTYRVSRLPDESYRCHMASFFIDYDSGDGSGNVNVGAFNSAVYGDVFNGYKEYESNFRVLPPPIISTGSNNLTSYTAYVDDGPMVQPYRTSVEAGFVPTPNDIISTHFLHSWKIPGRFWWYGELLTFNLWQGSASDVVSVINVNASIGRDVDIFSFYGVGWTEEGEAATTLGTAQIKSLIEAAIGASDAELIDPTTLDVRLNSNPITYFGHSAVDIRALPGTIAADKPILNVAIFAAPLTTAKEDIYITEN